MKLKSVLMTATSFVVLYASLMWCSDANSYSLYDLERKISIPIYAKDIRIQTRENGEIFRLERGINDDFSNYS